MTIKDMRRYQVRRHSTPGSFYGSPASLQPTIECARIPEEEFLPPPVDPWSPHLLYFPGDVRNY